MDRKDTSINPKSIVLIMFAVSIGFWANQLAQYANPTSKSNRLHLAAKELQSWFTNELEEYVVPTSESMESASEQLQDQIGDKIGKYVTNARGITYTTATELRSQITQMLQEHVNATSESARSTAINLKTRFENKLEKYIIATDPSNRRFQWWFTLGSGVLFLLDLLCLVWWYSKYIYRIQKKTSFGTYFLDFLVCSMFALAANTWTKPSVFLFATAFGSGLLIWRFVNLYYSSDVSMTDRNILLKARIMLLVALGIAVISMAMADKAKPGYNVFKYSLPGVLSGIGIILTLWMKTKIAVAADIYLAKNSPVLFAHLVWPSPEKGEEEKVRGQRERLRQGVKAGLLDFEELFSSRGKHDRVHSRVHSETELRIQSYILALPSSEEQIYAKEIQQKAFIVAASHWLDDLVDGRDEVNICEQLQKSSRSIGDVFSDDKEISGAKVETLFEQIYRPLIIKHTAPKFYDELYGMIIKSCTLEANIKYLLLGLIRVAYGSVVFSPKIPDKKRWEILNKSHNIFLTKWNNKKTGGIVEEVNELLGKMSVGDENDPGPIMLGLTTKTVQEVAMSNEQNELNVSLSILFSILYAPLIYYHNIRQELESGEMIPLQAFDTDSDLWIPWLAKTRKAIDDYDTSDRKQIRIKQIEMAYRCFEPKLPEFIRPELAKIYLRGPEDVSPVQKTN